MTKLKEISMNCFDKSQFAEYIKGSNELVGAKNVGMKAIQANWYTNQHPKKRGVK